MTLEQVKQEITERGYKLGRSFEDDQIVYASSFTSMPETLGIRWPK